MTGTNKPELVICRGLQASGKTTWANAWVAFDRANRIRINKDSLRAMIDDSVFVAGVTENRILAARDVLVRGLMQRGLSVVVDDTNLRQAHVKKLAKIAHECAWDWRVADFTDISLNDCIGRDLLREHGHVGAQVIKETYAKFLKGRELPLPIPTAEELSVRLDDSVQVYVMPDEVPDAVIIDIDGTVALHGTRSPFDESRVHEDLPNVPVIQAVQNDISVGSYPIFVSGRTEGCHAATHRWLSEHVTLGLPFDLYMRPVGDGRKDAVVKLEIFDTYIRNHFRIHRVYDDRNQVVQMWRSLGLTVLQVADGAF